MAEEERNMNELYYIMLNFRDGDKSPEELVARARELLMLPDVDVNHKTDSGYPLGRTALMNAARGGYIDLVRLLLETREQTGLDLDLQDQNGMTALMHAAENDKPLIVELLINGGADLNKRTDFSREEYYYIPGEAEWTALDLAKRERQELKDERDAEDEEWGDDFLITIMLLEEAMNPRKLTKACKPAYRGDDENEGKAQGSRKKRGKKRGKKNKAKAKKTLKKLLESLTRKRRKKYRNRNRGKGSPPLKLKTRRRLYKKMLSPILEGDEEEALMNEGHDTWVELAKMEEKREKEGKEYTVGENHVSLVRGPRLIDRDMQKTIDAAIMRIRRNPESLAHAARKLSEKEIRINAEVKSQISKLRKILRREIPERTKKTLRARAEKRMR